MKVFLWIVRSAVAGVLALSGIVKLNDPLGTAYKLEEYWAVFEADTGWAFGVLVPIAVPIAVVLIALELTLAVGLITTRTQVRKWMYYSLLALMVFFTWLTFYSAFFDKVTDCGCFGDAIPLTPWTSFVKDVVLLVAVLVLLRFDRPLGTRVQPTPSLWKELSPLLVPVLVTAIGASYVLAHLPWKDFLPYRVGADIPRLMQPSAPIQYIYVMEKAGIQHQFSQYPNDTSFHFVGMHMANPEAMPKITDYRLWRADEDQTFASLEGRKLMLVIEKAKPLDRVRVRTRLTQGVLGAADYVGDIWVISSGTETQYQGAVNDSPALRALPFYLADATLLKTMLRSPTGWILMQDGVIKGKWNSRDTNLMMEALRAGL